MCETKQHSRSAPLMVASEADGTLKRLTLCIDRPSFHRKARSSQFKEPLGALCRKYGSSICEDVKDKIFGLHAMAPPCCQEATVVDYGAPWLSIWQSVMVHHFLKHPNRPRLVVSMAQELQQKLSIGQVEQCDWSESTGLQSSGEMQHGLAVC